VLDRPARRAKQSESGTHAAGGRISPAPPWRFVIERSLPGAANDRRNQWRRGLVPYRMLARDACAASSCPSAA
jgi:hypothetical protein